MEPFDFKSTAFILVLMTALIIGGYMLGVHSTYAP